MSTELDAVPISTLADVNPSRQALDLRQDSEVSFIPMQDVSEGGEWTGEQIRRFNEVKAGYTPFLEGDVLFAKITPCMENGKGAHARGLFSGVGFGSTEFHVLRARSEVNDRFIYHWSRSPALRLKAQAFMIGSAGQQRVQPEFFDYFRVPLLPAPEQRRIAAILDTLDDAIRRTEQVIAKLQQMKQGLLHDLLTRGVDERGELRPLPEEAPHFYKDSPLGLIPKAWEATDLGTVASWRSGGTPAKSNPKFWDGTIPWLSPKDMKKFRLSDTEDHVTELGASVGTGTAPPGAIFVVVRGMILAHTFPVCIATKGMAFNQDVKAVVPKPGVDGRFLAHWFVGNADSMLRLVTEATHGTKRIDLKELTSHRLALPQTLEAERISARLDDQDVLNSLQAQEVKKLRAFRHGLQHDLLTGRVRVWMSEEMAG